MGDGGLKCQRAPDHGAKVLRFSVRLLAVASFALSFLGTVRTGTRIWRRSAGYAIFITNASLMLICLGTVTFLMRVVLGDPLSSYALFAPSHFFVIFSVVSQFLFCFLMAQVSENANHRIVHALEAFCGKHLDTPWVKGFVRDYGARDQIIRFVAIRTSGHFSLLAAVFGLWLVATIALMIWTKVSEVTREKASAVGALALDDDAQLGHGRGCRVR